MQRDGRLVERLSRQASLAQRRGQQAHHQPLAPAREARHQTLSRRPIVSRAAPRERVRLHGERGPEPLELDRRRAT